MTVNFTAETNGVSMTYDNGTKISILKMPTHLKVVGNVISFYLGNDLFSFDKTLVTIQFATVDQSGSTALVIGDSLRDTILLPQFLTS